jgi:hypothetical protein
VLTTQIEVDNFTTTYPNCTILTNSLTISGSDITDLSSLSGIIEFENQANIYFNFNAPIETNVAIIEVVDNLPIAEVELENSISMYPNPASEEIFIEMLNGAVFESAQLYSVLGVLVGSTSEAKLNLENLSEGIYFVKINTNTGQALRRIVVE